MKEIKIQVPDGKHAEWINGVLTLVDEPQVDNRPVTERIKTFEDACKELGDENALVQEYKDVCSIFKGKYTSTFGDILAYLKLRVVVAALNEGWEPQFTTDENRYYPWFWLYTQEEYDKMNKAEKRRCVLRSGGNTYASYGFVCVYASYDSSSSVTYVGSRLVFRTSALARYAGEQFFEEWADFMFNHRTEDFERKEDKE